LHNTQQLLLFYWGNMAEHNESLDPLGGDAPYIAYIHKDLDARSTWSARDKTIQKARLTERPTSKTKPYPNAPNVVVPILDDVISERRDQEVSMKINSPLLASFTPLQVNPQTQQPVDTGVIMQVQRAFDSFMRHDLEFRLKSELVTDAKDSRGFGVYSVITRQHDRMGVIPDFEVIDNQDCILPTDTQKGPKAERITKVLRFSRRKLEARGKRNLDPWQNISKLTDKLAADKDETIHSANDEDGALEVRKDLIGINVSDSSKDQIVVWEIMHYATKWDNANAGTKKDQIIVGKKCISYISPDSPDLLLNIKPWYDETTDEEGIITRKDRDWWIIQDRYENQTGYWYDVRGLGFKCMDNQIIATAVTNAKLVRMDYAASGVFEQDGDASTNASNLALRPGKIIPKGLKYAQAPPADPSFDFEVDLQKRDAAKRAGAGSGQFSGDSSVKSSADKTATEINSQDAQQGRISSAAVDRSNDADRQLFNIIWSILRKNKTPLPIVFNNQFGGMMPPEVYEIEWRIEPAGSQKTINTDMQYMKDKDVVTWAASFAQAGVNVDLRAGVKHTAQRHDPMLADALLPDDKAGQPTMDQQLQQLSQGIQQIMESVQGLEQVIETVGKAVMDNSDNIEELKAKPDGGERKVETETKRKQGGGENIVESIEKTTETIPTGG